MRKIAIETPISVGMTSSVRFAMYPSNGPSSPSQASGQRGEAPQCAPLPRDLRLVGQRLMYTDVCSPVLKSLNATYMFATRGRTTWNFDTATSGT